MSTSGKYTGEGFTLYEISDPHGPRGSIRLDDDGNVQFTPHSHMGCGIGTIWLSPEDGEAYHDVLAHLQRFAGTVPATQEVLQLEGVTG